MDIHPVPPGHDRRSLGGRAPSPYDGRGEEGIDVQLLKLHFESDVDFHRQVCKMAQISEAEWIELFKRDSTNKPIGKADIFLTFVLVALVNFKWSQPSALLAEKTKQRISRTLLDAGIEKSRRSRFSTTAVKFALKAIVYYSDNEHFIACRAGINVKQAIEHLNCFAEEMGCDGAFYKFKAWANAKGRDPLSEADARVALEFATGRSS